MGRTANSLVKERTFYVKVRNYLECTDPFFNISDPLRNTNLYRNFDGILLNEEQSTPYFTDANRVHELINFGTTIRDWTNSYNNGVWTVSGTKDYKIDLELQLQHSIGGPSFDFFNDGPIVVNGGIYGMIRLYKLPSTSSTIIPNGDAFDESGVNPFVSLTDSILLDTKEFAIVYNQDQGGGRNKNSGVYGSGTGTIAPLAVNTQNPTMGNAGVTGASFDSYFAGVSYTYNNIYNNTSSTWQNYYNGSPISLDNANTGYDTGEYYDNGSLQYGNIDQVQSLGVKLNSCFNAKSNNKYNINIPRLSLLAGDRIYAVVSAQFVRFGNPVNGDPSPIDINNSNREGGILYQWAGSGSGRSRGNQPTLANGGLILQNGTFTAKSIL